MSGFLLAWSPDGGRIDANVLDTIRSNLCKRYSDGTSSVCLGSVGAAFATLNATDDVREFSQPHQSSEGWLCVSDARLTNRGALRSKLPEAALPADAADGEYLPATFRRWGPDCVNHLRGEYAFALCDEQGLFAAHDAFAMVPVYYAKAGATWVVSNDLWAVLSWTGIDDRLNDQFIADFLMFGMNMDMGTTAYRGIRRLKPGQAMTINRDGVQTWQHYCLPTRQIDRRRSAKDTVAEFRELLAASVRDRLRWPKTSTHLSGGMDSNAVAALAAEHLVSDNVWAHNFRYGEWFDDEDATLAALTAGQLGIRLKHYDMEPLWRTPLPPEPLICLPEPLNLPHWRAETYSHTDAAGFGPVILTGFGGDPLLNPGPVSPPRRAWRGLRQWVRSVRNGAPRASNLPAHLSNAPFARNYPLADRWREINSIDTSDQRSGMLDTPLWSNMFAWSMPSFQPRPVALRYPFFDLRLIEFVQTVPRHPWLRRKHLLREAMRGALPDVIVDRPKTNLPLNIYRVLESQIGMQPWQKRLVEGETGRYYSDILRLSETADGLSFIHAERLTALLYWLDSRSRAWND